MTDRAFIVGILIFLVLITGLLYVFFGQITVRKLRKNQKTKHELGMEYASGWDIINVAQALALPRSWSRKLEKSQLSFMHSNSELLFENTSKFDQWLAKIFYWLFMISGLLGVLLVLLNSLGVFNE